ncbi:unnamed protein product, partial [Hapterophycus canaliculatus]
RKPTVVLAAAIWSLPPTAVGFTSVAVVKEQHQRHPPECRISALTCGGSTASSRAGTDLACVLKGAEVALTREAGKNGKLAKLLADAGISSVEVPCIAHQDGPDLRLLPAALADPGLAYVVVTSPEAAKVFLAGWTTAGGTPVPVACVGKATGDTLRAGGVTPVFTPSKATGETLAAEIPLVPAAPAGVVDSLGESGGGGSEGGAAAAAARGAPVAGGEVGEGAGAGETPPPRRPRVLYPASAKAQKTLESGLEARGFEVCRLNTYDTVPATWDEGSKAAAAGAAVAAFGSPSAVKTWAARMGVAKATAGGADEEGGGDEELRQGTRRDAEGENAGPRGSGSSRGGGGALAACIGQTSARACREAGWPESAIFYPEKPGMDGWAKAVGDALAATQTAPSPAEEGDAAA